jgi:hypothetical protein
MTVLEPAMEDLMSEKERAALMATAGHILLAQAIRELRESGALSEEAVERIFRRADNLLSASFPTDMHSGLLAHLRAIAQSSNEW